jgi:hypothetical protein
MQPVLHSHMHFYGQKLISPMLTKHNLLSVIFAAYCNWIIILQGKFFTQDEY